MLYKDMLKEYILEKKLQNYSSRTLESYKRNNEKFIQFYLFEFSNTPHIEEVTRVHYKAFISHLIDRGLKATYINSILKCNKAFWTYMKEERFVESSPLSEIKLLKEEKTIITTFNDKEVKAMLNFWKFDSYLGARNKTIIATFLDTGIRVTELLNLRNSDISGGYMRVHGKGNKWRVVPLSDTLQYFIKKYQRIRDTHFKKLRNYNAKKRIIDENLFLSKTGKKIITYPTVELMIKETAKAIGVRDEVRASPHTLRHYYSVKNLQQNQDIFTISKILGHESIKTTSIYLRSITDTQIIEKAKLTSPLEHLK